MISFDDIDFRYINAELIMTNGCNLACDYCFEREHMPDCRNIQKLSYEDTKGYMDLILRNREERKTPSDIPSWINFFGGEPCLCWDTIVRIMKEYSIYPFFRYTIVTNGILLTEEMLEEVKEFPIFWQLSLDSANPDGNKYRFKDKTVEYTNHILDIIEKIIKMNFITPLISSVFTDQSIPYIVETYHYFASRRLPVKWQGILERLNNQDALLEEYNRQNLEIVDLLVKDPFNIPSLWQNIISHCDALKKGESISMDIALSEAPSPNNLYIVGPNGKLYFNTNDLNIYETTPLHMSIGGLPLGIDLNKVKNHPWLRTLKTDISACKDCPSFAVNPCCIEKKFFMYPSQFKGNCNTFLSATFYSLEYMRRKEELNELR